MRMIVTDAGRKQYKPGERNDCTVRAFAKIFNISYKEAHAFIETMGRKERKGYPLPYWMYLAWVNKDTVRGKKIEHKFYLPDFPRYTVEQFMKTHHDGRYMIQVGKTCLCSY
jgi:hypothetical protein